MEKELKIFGSKLDAGHHMVGLAKGLRRRETKAEKVLRQQLRWKKLGNIKFRRQHPIGNYIADFYCSEKKIIIELDGKIHDSKENKESDKERDLNLAAYGIKTLRFKNSEIFENIEKVLQKILKQ